MEQYNFINAIRPLARDLVRELGVLQVSKEELGISPQVCHALVELDNEPNLTISELSDILVLSPSATSRLVDKLIKDGLLSSVDSHDKRQKLLRLTPKGHGEMVKINDYSNRRIRGAMSFLSLEQQQNILKSMSLYVSALKKYRQKQDEINIYTLSTSRKIRRQIVLMIEKIQRDEFGIDITPDINSGVLQAEKDYYFKNKYNFWYAVDGKGSIIGCVGLKQISDDLCEIKKFFVASSHRGLGLAQLLMKKLSSRAEKAGFKQAILGTVDVLHSAIRFYEKKGFKRIHEAPENYVKCPLDTHFFIIDVDKLKQAF